MSARFILLGLLATFVVLLLAVEPADAVSAQSLVWSKLQRQRRPPPKNPFNKGSYNWWLFNIENKISVPSTESFLRTHSCECLCAVTDPAAKTPFNCKCNCPPFPEAEQGDHGEPGDEGEQGLRGPEGVPGDPGDKGPRGPSGLKGEQGERGQKGAKGKSGIDGRNGRSIPGPEGPKGRAGFLSVGPAGPKGPSGPRGFKGYKGEKGPVRPGPIGERGITGIGGDPGDRGFKGVIGPRGPRGIPGPRGNSGGDQPSFQPDNIMGQLTAQGACMGAAGNNIVGYISAVMRECSEDLTCDHICKNLTRSAEEQPGKCFESLHVFAAFAKPQDKASSGLITHKFGTCSTKGCGANYCCCAFEPRAAPAL